MIAAGQVKPPGAPGGPPAGAAGPAAGGEEAAARPPDHSRKGQPVENRLSPEDLRVEEGEHSFVSLESPTPDTPNRRLREVSREGDVIRVKVHAYEVQDGREHEYVRTSTYNARTGKLHKEGKWIDMTRINEEMARIRETLKPFPGSEKPTADALRARTRLFGEGRVTGKEDPPGKKPKVETK